MLLRGLLLFLVLFFLKVTAQVEPSITAKIQKEIAGNFVTLRAFVENKKEVFEDELNYNLVVLKYDAKGNLSKNNQSGDFSIAPNQEKKVSEVKVNLTNQQRLKSFLFIKQRGKLIYRDTLFLFSRLSQKKIKKNREADFAIRGIVIDQAKTRIGKDYHDFFYKEYVVTRKNYPFVVTIKEKPGMGSQSIITIVADYKELHQFYARPEEDYLKQNVAIAMQKLRRYNRTRKSVLSY